MLENYEPYSRRRNCELYRNEKTGHKILVKTTDVLLGVHEVSVLRDVKGCYFPQLLEYGLVGNKMRIVMSAIQADELVYKEMRSIELYHFIRQAFLALKALHQDDILHNDIKPENILMDGYSNAYLVDFGSALKFDAIKKQTNFVNNVEYCAPEVLLMPEKMDYRSDYYSMARVITKIFANDIKHLSFSMQQFLWACSELDISKRPKTVDNM